jgi:methylmalonyl-CoA/ethylmalonyl-CoA epimerase
LDGTKRFLGEIMTKIRLDHIGLAVNSLDEGVEFWKILGLISHGEDERNHEQGVDIRFLTTQPGEPPLLELLSPISPDTVVAKFIQKRGVGVQQLAFEVENLQETIDSLQSAGVKMIDAVPKHGSHGTKIAFVHPSSTGGVLVELLEK